MSKKKIEKRLDQLFFDLKIADDGNNVNPLGQASSRPETLPEEKIASAPRVRQQRIPSKKSTGVLPAIETMTEISSLEPASTLALPIQVDTDMWGLLKVSDPDRERDWSPEEQLLVKQVVDQLSLAMENARLFQQTRSRAEELATLNELGRSLASDRSLEQVLDEVFRGVSRLIDTSNFYIGLYDSPKNEVHFVFNATESQIDKQIIVLPADQGITGYIIRTREPVLIKDGVPAWLEMHEIPQVGEAAQSWLGVPLILGDQVMGVMAVQNYKIPYAYDEHDSEIFIAIANQAAISIHNAQLFKTVQDRAEEMASVNRIIATVSGFLDIETSMEMVAEEVQNLLGAQNISITFTDQDKESLRLIANVPPRSGGVDPASLVIPIKENPAIRQVIETRRPQFIPDVLNSGLTGPMQAVMVARDTKNAYLMPILLGFDVLGVVSIEFTDSERFLTEREIQLLETIGIQTATAIQKVRLFEETTKSREQLTEALRIGRMGYFEYDLTTGLLTITNEMFSLVETDASQEGGDKFPLRSILRKYVLAEDLRSILASIQDLFSHPEKGTLSQEVRFKTKSGKIIWVENIYTIVLGDNGAYNKIIGSSQDITERKHSEEMLQRQNEYLSISTEIGRLITSTLDRDTLFSRAVNLIRDRFLFYHTAIFIIEDTGFKAILESATGEAGAEMKRRGHYLAVGSQSIVGKVAHTGEHLVVNNTAIDLTHMANPLLPSTRAEAAIPLRVGNRIIGILDIQSENVNAFSENDVAILQSLADQIAIAIDNARSYELAQQAVNEMRELDRIKSQFLANMSHELRTPLNSIIGFSRVILKGIDGPITETQQQDLNAIYNSGQHLLRLINDILDLSKIEAGKMELAFDDVNLADIITSVLPTISGLMKDKPIKLRHAIAGDLPIIRADPMRLRQVLINLLSNAAKFTEEGEIFVEASRNIDSTGQEEILVSVKDTGPGISPEDQGKLFQPFSQVDASLTRKSGGTGLGLSISRHLVELHNGRIGLHSSDGQGSTFYFTLPIPKPKEDSPVKDTRGSKVILAIDDDSQVISLYERYLQPQGYQVVALTDPIQAKERVKQLKPFAVTLDIMMPGRDGWQVLNDLKSDPETRDIPVIICSILEEEEKGFSLGATDYLVKPILEDELLNAINRLNSDGSIRDVLVIDNDPEDLRLIGKILNQSTKYRAILAEGGQQGWQAISSNPPHAVILDLFMPDLDGFTILGRLRANSILRDMPVIVISGADLSPEQQQQLDHFGQNLLRKGALNDTELFTMLDKALNRLSAWKGA